MIEAICRQYITGSMWRSYEKGERSFCGFQLPDGLEKDKALPELLMTPSTKGIIKGIADIPEVDDVNITRKNIEDNYQAFNFTSPDDIKKYEQLLREGYVLISNALAEIGQIFVDTKFEFGYVQDSLGQEKLIYMDEVGTPDSSRIWDEEAYEDGHILENSKEGFRQFLIGFFSDSDILLNKDRMDERLELASSTILPKEALLNVSDTYLNIASKITGKSIKVTDNPRKEIIEILDQEYGLIM